MTTDEHTEATPEPGQDVDATDTPDSTTDATDPDPVEDTPITAARKDAARYRRRLRDTEAEVERLRQVVEGHNRQTVERLAADHLADPQDLWTAGVDLDQLLDDSGNIDPDTLTAQIEQLLESKPHWRKPRFPNIGDAQGAGRGINSPPPRSVDEGWQSIIRADTPPA